MRKKIIFDWRQWQKAVPIAFWLFVFIALCCYLQRYGAYHFYYIEQEQLFLYSPAYWLSLLARPGGGVRLMAEYLVQFFVYPYAGALIMSFLLTGIGVLTEGIVRRAGLAAALRPFCLIPVITLLYVHFDVNYYYSGTVGFALALLALNGYVRTNESLLVRMGYALLIGAVLFWIAGAVAILFAGCIFLWELPVRFKRSYLFLFPALLIILMVWGSVYFSFSENYRAMLLPDGYFRPRLRPGWVLYYPWIALPALLLLAGAMRRTSFVSLRRRIVGWIFQGACIVALVVAGVKITIQPRSDFFKKLSYYMQTERWDDLIVQCNSDIKNYLYMCCLNVALAEKGKLADQLFAFDQRGVEGIYLSWNRTAHGSVLMSDVYFSMGHIALAQRMAFEANMSTVSEGKPRMIKRLVQTNLIFGSYPVAEKYIALLERTMYYKKWAQAQRRFLWNDEAVNDDPLLGKKRRCIPHENELSELGGLNQDLFRIAEQNPAHTATIQYVGALYLLIKDMYGFKQLIEKYYGTKVLPVLPKSFQEAVIILSEQDPDYWVRFNVSEMTIRRYAQYRQQALSNKNLGNALPGLLKRSFGDTYWYYFMFTQVEPPSKKQ